MRARSCFSLLVWLLGAGGVACVSTRPLSPAEARALGENTWDAPTEEVFDATWLTLTDDGFTVQRSDRVAGTLVVTRGGRGWDVEVAARGDRQKVVLAPQQETSHQELVELLDVLQVGTARLLRAWKRLPEWKYDGRKNLLKVPGFAVAPPPAWEFMDLDVSRRRVVVQQWRARSNTNATLLVEIERRRPDRVWAEPLKKAAGLTLEARQRLTLPGEVAATEDERGVHGALKVLDGTLPKDVVWHGLHTVLGPTDVQVVMVCPKAAARECQALWGDVVGSVLR